jgi:hypothetical protein
LTFDRDGQPGSHTHFVGYVQYVNDAGGRHTLDGSLRLVDYDGSWKVDELFFDTCDSQPFPRQVVLSVDYPLFVAAASTQDPSNSDARLAPSAPTGTTPNPIQTPAASPQASAAAARAVGPSLNGLLGPAGDGGAASAAAESRAATAAAREAEEAGHEAGGLLSKGGKAAGAGLLALAAMLLKGLGSLSGGDNSKRKNKTIQLSDGSATPPSGPTA